MKPGHQSLLLICKTPSKKYKRRMPSELPGRAPGWRAEKFPRGELGELLALMYKLDHHALRNLRGPLRPTSDYQHRL